MAYYSHYTSLPSWGTSQYRFLAPPLPQYQPQPSWGGLDFYRAHAGNAFDSALYNQVWPRAQGLTASSIGAMAGAGGSSGMMGLAEAQYWHQRIYGGLTDIRSVLPSDIGAAAAFEAWRNWQAHNSVYAQPLAGDTERMREALVGLAIAEASRLYQYTPRIADHIGLSQACEVAALTVSRIFFETSALGAGGSMGTGGMGMRMGGMGMSPAMGGMGMSPSMGGMGGMGMGIGMGGLSPRLSPRQSPLLSPALSAGGYGFPGTDPTAATLGVGVPPGFPRRRSMSVGAISRAGTPVPVYPGSGQMMGGAQMGDVGGDYGMGMGMANGMGMAGGMGMGMGIPGGYGAIPLDGGLAGSSMGMGMGMVPGAGAYPYGASNAGVGSYALAPTLAYAPSRHSRSRSRHRHHHHHHNDGRRHRSHSSSGLYGAYGQQGGYGYGYGYGAGAGAGAVPGYANTAGYAGAPVYGGYAGAGYGQRAYGY